MNAMRLIMLGLWATELAPAASADKQQQLHVRDKLTPFRNQRRLSHFQGRYSNGYLLGGSAQGRGRAA